MLTHHHTRTIISKTLLEMAKLGNPKHIVLFPFMANGHLTPFLALARKLDQRENYKITIVNTPQNIQMLRKLLPMETKICLAEIFLHGTDFGHVENTNQMSSFSEFMSLFEASKLLENSFKSLIMEIIERDDMAPVCIIADMFLGWTVNVAREFGIFHSVFIPGTGYSMGLYFSISLNKNFWKCGEEDIEFSVPDFPEVGKLENSRLGLDFKYIDGINRLFQFRVEQFSFCLFSDAVLLNTMEGLDFHGEEYFRRKMSGKPVFSIGTISPSIERIKDNLQTEGVEFSYSEWLDLKEPKSTLYISFGTQNRISLEQMMELAIGLEASKKDFIWVLRPPIEYNAREEFRDEWLPKGFKDRISRENRGLFAHTFAPQQEILSHNSVGGFVSHCGWNSVLESLSEGVPIIGWPLMAEQLFNSQMLEKELGVCLEIGRANDSGIVNHNHICKVIKTVMDKTTQGEEMRRRAMEIKRKMEDAVEDIEGYRGSSIKAIDEFLVTAISNTKTSYNSRK